MNIVVVDIGGTNVKVWKTNQGDKTKFRSGKKLTPSVLVEHVNAVVSGWSYERVSIGYPGEVLNGQPVAEPFNLGRGWLGFDFASAFKVPVRLMNDACMQALGSYDRGRMLYLGLGTSFGTNFMIDGLIVPLALGHLRLCRGESFEQSLSAQGLKAHGAKRWCRLVNKAAKSLKDAFLADYVILGGGNAKELRELPEGCRRGGNHNAYFGGLRMWEDVSQMNRAALAIHG
jgi:polyphosphate glucokinase